MKYAVVFFCILFTQGQADLCAENITVYDIPHDPIVSLLGASTLNTVINYSGCYEKYLIDPNLIKLWLYNKQHHEDPIQVDYNNPATINPKNKIVFVIHGWICNVKKSRFLEVKDAYLKRYPNSNIIFIDWKMYSFDYYVGAVCRVPKIAEFLGQFICNLGSLYNIDLQQLHLVGHSMGAHLAGIIGQETQKICRRKIGRITGLDPAGPLYQLAPVSRRLDESDALIVDVIHTNQGILGYYGPCGTVDFYPNCGYFQPGCQELPLTTNFTQLMHYPAQALMCSHLRSIHFFTESILSDNFVAKSCTLCPGALLARVCITDYFFASSSTMGEGYIMDPGTSKQYYLKTNTLPPFSQA